MPSAEITLERSMFFGLIFTSILYGVDLMFFFLSLRLLWKQPRMSHRKLYIVYSSFLLLFLTISLATNCTFGDLMWIDDRNVSGGPPAFYVADSSAWYNTLGTATDVAALAMADGLLLYRCFMFWHDRRWIVLFPALLYVASIAMGILMTIDSALPGANIFQGLAATFSISWLSLTVSFNVIVTSIIIGRVFTTYWTVRQSLGPPFLTTYVDVSAMLIESALPFSVLGICYLVSQSVGSNVAIAFAFVWGTFAALSPQFIIYRVALGVAWSKDTVLTTSQDMHFARNPDGEFQSDKKRSSGELHSTLGGSDHIDF